MKKSLIYAIMCATFVLSAGEAEYVRQELAAGGDIQHFRINANLPEQFNRKPLEAGSVKFDCDEKNLYFTITMADNDLVSEAENDQSPLRNLGDAIQIFLKSEKDTYIWEFQVDSQAHRSYFFHQGPGRIFYPNEATGTPDFSVENTITDGQWITKITIPLSIFKAKGFDFTDAENWTFLIVRHNFSRFNDAKETSSYPQVVGNMYNPARFGRLILKR